MSPAHRSTAPDPIMREIVHEDQRTSQQCKAEDCHQQIKGRARVDGDGDDGGEIRALCTACLAEACGVSEAAVQRATGGGFKASEGSRR